MANTSQKGRSLRKVLLVCVLILICIAIGLAAFHKTPWMIPAEELERKNPLS